MSGKTYSKVQKLAGAALAKLKGENEAADELKVDRRAIRRWLAAAPDDGWQLARDLAHARLQEQLATGKVAPSQLATIAGIAERNVRYGELIRQREERRQAQAEPKPEIDPEQAAVRAATDALPHELRRWLTTYIDNRQDLDLFRQQVGMATEPAEEHGRPLSEWLQWLAGTTPEQRQAMDDELAAEADELMAGWRVIRTGRPDHYMHRVLDADGGDVALRGNYLGALFARLPVIDESPPTATRDVTPAPEPPKALPGPVVAVQRAPVPLVASMTPDDPLDTDTQVNDDLHPTWRRWE